MVTIVVPQDLVDRVLDTNLDQPWQQEEIVVEFQDLINQQLGNSRTPTEHTGGSQHYTQLKVQPWDAMECWLTKEEFIGSLKASAIKRLGRAHTKGVELEDLIKAHHELGKAIELLKESKE